MIISLFVTTMANRYKRSQFIEPFTNIPSNTTKQATSMATLQNKTIVVVGGSSGIGFAVALASLQSSAERVIIASSNESRVNGAVARLKSHNFPGEVCGEFVDAKDSAEIKTFADRIGTVDHIVWTSGDIPSKSAEAHVLPFTNVETPEQGQSELTQMYSIIHTKPLINLHYSDAFSVRFWGPFVLAKHAKFHPGGSLTLTSGMSGF